MFPKFTLFLSCVGVVSSFMSANRGIMKISTPSRTQLDMSVYSTDQGILAQLVEERDACGVGFIANLSQKPSHGILAQAVEACNCMEHRGATSADNVSGDGAGIMTAIPWKLYSSMIDPTKHSNKDGSIAAAVGQIFLPQNPEDAKIAIDSVETSVKAAGLKLVGWRDVPVDPEYLGDLSRDFVPTIKQVVVTAGDGQQFKDQEEMDKTLYEARRKMHGLFRMNSYEGAYVCSFSTRTIVYKGMLRSCDLPRFYKDLTNPDYESVFAVYHRRFSTNTVPKWFLAQPMRMLAHNGEINTLLGNINWVKSKQYAKRNENMEVFIEPNDFLAMKNGGEGRVIGPLVDTGRSDSANLDSIIETFVKGGKSPEEALMVLVPEAYASQPKLKTMPELQSFYSYYESLQEAWDGPALLVFSDGDMVGAALDRNGLRPARYMVVSDENGEETIHVMSEVGVTKSLDQFAGPDGGHLVDANLKLVDSGRIGPGQMISVDLREGKIGLNDEVKNKVAKKMPYQKWMKDSLIEFEAKPFKGEVKNFAEAFVADPGARTLAISKAGDGDYYSPVTDEVDNENLIQMQSAFGWGIEDVEIQISAMAGNGVEATYCMGDDAPLAALSSMPHVIYDYFKQRFAQVTNPPIDPLREGAVMSLNMFLGPRGDPLAEGQSSKRVKISSPVMNFDEVEALKAVPGVTVTKLSTLYPLKEALTQGGLQGALDRLSAAAVDAVKSGATILDLSDADLMAANEGAARGSTLFIPPLLAVANVHHTLIAAGLRPSVSLVVSTGQAWSTHHIATLVGYGASAVVPYAAYNAVINWHSQKRVQNTMERGDVPKISATKALANYRKALDKGILKILSKIGISLLTSYHGAQIFEALGISDDVISTVFKGTPSRLGGLTMDDIAAEGAEFHRKTFGDEVFVDMIEKVEGKAEDGIKKKLFNYGFLNYFKSGEYHHNNQPLIKQLHNALRNHDRDLYQLYEQDVQNRPVTTLRDTLQFNTDVRESIPLEEVEPIENIMQRFCTGGMSLGALSREAHETLAIALNRIGGKSNSGEGGEDFIRTKILNDVDSEGVSPTLPHLKGLQNGDIARSKIKQVASGRFGVTAQYLMSGDQLEIKVAQGAKPGEGGQLPGAKIDEYIAGLRKSKPGVTLISPPPHHDIYSIEDLAQLIYDLHQVNEKAGVSVKLVSEVGIGTVASGVAKAGADIIQISGHDGGTGASPVSSIKHAGSAWELGLAEAHATLMSNGLRDRVLLRVDGGLKSGWDVVMAALMGAEEFGFGTIAMIAEGCIMARICHTNKCPVGITTQTEALRKRFPGTPDNIVTFFTYVAEEVRHILAKLGYRSLEELIGAPGMLKAREGIKLKKIDGAIDTSFILDSINECQPVMEGLDLCDIDRSWLKKPEKPYSNGYTFDDKVLEDPEIKAALEKNDGGVINKQYHMVNTDRSAFARLAGQIAVRYGDYGYKGSMKFDLTGAAGQAFGAFICTGIDVVLDGYANDYVCKGMSGGSVVVNPPSVADTKSTSYRDSSKHSCVGNTVLYGASGGSLLVRGRGGERFAVRNSGALGILEGLGDHGCEYMTAGTVIVLGNTGRNFGAGMTGGLAFVLDDEAWLDGDSNSKGETLPFIDFVNDETCTASKLSTDYVNAKQFLKESLTKHFEATGSARAKRVLDNLDEAMGKVWSVVPNSEKANPIVLNSKVPDAAMAKK